MRDHCRHEDGDWWVQGNTLWYRLPQSKEVLFIDLCSLQKPLDGGRPIFRRGEAEWQIAPVEFYDGEFHRIPNEDPILLTGAPTDINDLLATF